VTPSPYSPSPALSPLNKFPPYYYIISYTRDLISSKFLLIFKSMLFYKRREAPFVIIEHRKRIARRLGVNGGEEVEEIEGWRRLRGGGD
jgi:hypothetical protein